MSRNSVSTLKRLRGVLATLLLIGCSITGPDVDTQGTVELVGVEGGCWRIHTDSQNYEPINLPPAFRVDGLRVDFQGDDAKGYATFCMVGKLIVLTQIRRVGTP